MLVNRGRLTLNMDVDSWLAEVDKIPAVAFVPVDNSVSVKSTCLPGDFHKDIMVISIFRSNAKTQNYLVIATFPKKIFNLSPNVFDSRLVSLV